MKSACPCFIKLQASKCFRSKTSRLKGEYYSYSITTLMPFNMVYNPLRIVELQIATWSVSDESYNKFQLPLVILITERLKFDSTSFLMSILLYCKLQIAIYLIFQASYHKTGHGMCGFAVALGPNNELGVGAPGNFYFHGELYSVSPVNDYISYSSTGELLNI